MTTAQLNAEIVCQLRDGLGEAEIARRLELTHEMVSYIADSLVTKLGTASTPEGPWANAQGSLPQYDEGDSD